MPWFLLIACALAIEPVHVEFSGADSQSALRFLANVGDINFIAAAPPSAAPVSGVFTTPTVRELFDRLSEAQGYRSLDSNRLVVLSDTPLEHPLPSGPYSGHRFSIDVQRLPFSTAIRFVGDLLDCSPLVAWNDIQDSLTMRLDEVPGDQALEVLLAIEGEAGTCTPGGFLDRHGTGEGHRLRSISAGAHQQPEPQGLPSGVTVRRRRHTWLIEGPPAEMKATRRLIRDGRQDPWPTMDTDGPGWLQGYALDRLDLVGTATGSGRPAALIVDPSGQGHTITVGTYLGRDWGKVTAISATSLTVFEEYQTLEGELVNNTIVMQLGEHASL